MFLSDFTTACMQIKRPDDCIHLPSNQHKVKASTSVLQEQQHNCPKEPGMGTWGVVRKCIVNFICPLAVIVHISGSRHQAAALHRIAEVDCNACSAKHSCAA